MAHEHEQHVKATPKMVFMHLLLIAMLYTSVVSFIALLFQYVNLSFPDLLHPYYSDSYDAIRLSSASLIIAFPVFILMSWMIGKELRQNPEKRDAWVRKWLVYLTLFIAAVTIIIDLIRLVYNFYSGELTLPFALKVIVVLIVAAAVFGYYLWELHRKEEKNNMSKMCAWIASIILLAVVVGGFFIAGTPAHQRQVRFDEQRVNDLQNIQSQIIYYWQSKNTLPEKLSDLRNDLSGFTVPVDPETGEQYSYTVKGAQTFTVCVNFKTENTNPTPSGSAELATPYRAAPAYNGYADNWAHGMGMVCFERTIDPDLYKTDSPPVKYQ